VSDSTAATGPVDGELVHFSGPPGALQAVVTIRNASDEDRQLRRTVPRPQRQALAADGAYSAHFAQRALLAPGAALAVPVRLAVPPDTPPGDHEVSIDIDGERQRAVLHVCEVVSAAVSPAEIIIGASAGEQRRRIVVTNSGNIDITIASTAAPLDDELLTCRIMRTAVRQFAGNDHGGDEGRPEGLRRFEDFLSELVRQTDQVLRDAGVLRVRSIDGPVVVRPGQVTMVDMAFSVPETLDRHTRYSAVVPIATADLVVRVVPSIGVVAERRPRRSRKLGERRST
jgi:hypothetical protein